MEVVSRDVVSRVDDCEPEAACNVKVDEKDPAIEHELEQRLWTLFDVRLRNEVKQAEDSVDFEESTVVERLLVEAREGDQGDEINPEPVGCDVMQRDLSTVIDFFAEVVDVGRSEVDDDVQYVQEPRHSIDPVVVGVEHSRVDSYPHRDNDDRVNGYHDD